MMEKDYSKDYNSSETGTSIVRRFAKLMFGHGNIIGIPVPQKTVVKSEALYHKDGRPFYG